MKTQKFSKLVFLMAISCLCFVQAKSQEKQEDKIIATTQVLKDFGNMKESIPSELLKVTEGIIVVPKLINGGFVLAAKRGKGIAMVKLPDGTWSNPVFVTLTGGSVDGVPSLWFYDINAKINHKFDDSHKIFPMYFSGPIHHFACFPYSICNVWS